MPLVLVLLLLLDALLLLLVFLVRLANAAVLLLFDREYGLDDDCYDDDDYC